LRHLATPRGWPRSRSAAGSTSCTPAASTCTSWPASAPGSTAWSPCLQRRGFARAGRRRRWIAGCWHGASPP